MFAFWQRRIRQNSFETDCQGFTNKQKTDVSKHSCGLHIILILIV